MSDDDELSHGLEKLDTSSPRRIAYHHASDENPFQRCDGKNSTSVNASKSASLWPSATIKCHCPHATSKLTHKHRTQQVKRPGLCQGRILKQSSLLATRPHHRDGSCFSLEKLKETLGGGEEREAAKEAPSSALVEDTSMCELAGYFDNLLNIPKQMSSMAEMMYS